MKNLLKFAMIAVMAIFITSCSNDDDNNVPVGPVTIAQFVANNPDYSSLGAALDRASLTEVLNGTINFTVFAPNNAAFDTFLADNGFANLEAVPVDVLTNVLLNHVISGTVMSADLTTGYINTSATFADGINLSMYVDTTVGVKLNGGPEVTLADVEVSNGVIHAVNAVIGLPTIVTFATADPTFTSLVGALTRSDQPDYVSVLSTPNGIQPAPFTVFAPTNAAFISLLAELNLTDPSEIDTATLTATLNTHVVPEANVRSTDLTDGPVSTLGDDLIVDATNATLTDPNGRVSNIIVVDVQAANGVIHVIDKVVLPQL